MEAKKRRSDRITAQLPIVVSGVDVMGQDFAESGRTLVIARHGAKILCQRKLTPQLEITIRCLMTTEEAEARVVGQVQESSEGISYGIELLDREVDLWGVEFPPIEQSATALGRILCECVHCHKKDLVYLNECEAEVLERSRSIWRECKRCGDATLWKETWLKSDEDLPTEEAAPAAPAPPPKRTRDDRKNARLDLQMIACIRDPQGWEEVVKTENLSRGGMRFKSQKHYSDAWVVEVALPYSQGGANIFSAAKVKNVGEVPGTTEHVYGVAYVAWQDDWADRWKG